MASLRSNIIANLAGAAWAAGLTIIITPLQVNLLGIDAYGLISLIAVLQVMLSALDLGLAATITRSIASDLSTSNKASLDLLDSAATLYWAISIIVGVALFEAASEIAASWFTAKTLDHGEVTRGMKYVAIYLALRWPVTLYSGVLSGLQRMDLLNLIKAASITLRLGGGLVLLLFKPDLAAFLRWFVLCAAIELMWSCYSCHKLIPAMSWLPRIKLRAVQEVWKFSVSMNLIYLFTVLSTQLGALLISILLGLEAFGYYSLAYNVAVGLTLIYGAFNSASLPALTSGFEAGDLDQIRSQTVKLGQLIAYVVTLPSLVLVFFGYDILRLWIGASAAAATYATLALLACGFLIHALVSTSHILTVACGHPWLSVKAHLFGLLIYAPALYIATRHYGIEGAAFCWLALNLGIMFSFAPIVHASLLNKGFRWWLSSRFVQFIFLGILCFGVGRLAAITFNADSLVSNWLALGLAVLGYSIAGYRLLSIELQRDIKLSLVNLYQRQAS